MSLFFWGKLGMCRVFWWSACGHIMVLCISSVGASWLIHFLQLLFCL